MNELAADLTAVKEYLQTHGRCNDGMYGPGTSVCLIVGISRGITVAMGVREVPLALERVYAVWKALYPHLPIDRVAYDGDLVGFNEHPLTTDADVWMLFDKAIVEAGGMA